MRRSGISLRIPPLSPLWETVLLGVMAAVLFYSRLGCELLEPEEARYAEIPRQMLEQGRFVTPVLHGEDYYQKPPLLYWLIMLSYRVCGVHDWAARLVSCTCGVLIVLITYWWGRRATNPASGLVSGLILCLSARFVYLGGMVTMDCLLCLWVILALALAHLGAVKRRLTWWLLSALACGLGMLTKGPVAAALVIPPLGLWTIVSGGWHALSRTPRACHPPRSPCCNVLPGGAPIFRSHLAPLPRPSLRWWLLYALASMIAVPWYLAAGWRSPGSTSDFFWVHNLMRYLAPFDHEKPAWFYLPGLLVGTLPWSFLIVPMVKDWIRRRREPEARLWETRPNESGLAKNATSFFIIALVWCVLFFSVSGCKRGAYILPAFPLLALTLGAYLNHGNRVRNWRPWIAGFATVYVLILGATWTLLPDYHRRFGMRRQVEAQINIANELPVVCLPKRWDSVSFYLQREVAVRDLSAPLPPEPALVFVKRQGALPAMLRELPADSVFVPVDRQGHNVVVGRIHRR